MKTFWETFLLTLFRISAIIIALAVLVWWLSVSSDEIEEEVDPFSVTITYRCKEVLADVDEIPDNVVSKCKKLAKELQNATKSNKSGV